MKIKALFALTVIVLIAGLLSSCGISDAEIAQTEEAIQSTAGAQSTGTVSAERTVAAVTQQHETEFAGTSVVATETQSAVATATADKATQQSLRQLTLAAYTEAASAEQTESVSKIYNIVQDLFDEGYISKTQGEFTQLPFWEDSYAQIRYYKIEPLWGDISDFVMVVDVAWASASTGAEISTAGCGITFRASETYDEYYTFLLNLDGNMSFFARESSSSGAVLSKAYWGKLDYMEDSTTFIITAEGNTFQVFNEDLERIDLRIGNKLTSGGLAYVLSSGGNEGFGTRCTFNDTDLWVLDD